MIISGAHLPPIIAGLRRSEPDIEIELVPSDTTSNLLYREADIALRMFRPRQLDLVTLHLGDIALGTFAARSYVARRGLPRRPDEMAAHDVVGFDRDPAILEGFAQMGVPVTRSFFPVRCDDNLVYWELVRAGCGIGFAQREMGLADPDMVEIDLGLPLPTLPVWLTAHEAMRETPRLRRVWRALQEGLAPLVS
jgi:DNA-binding transcriptional LysR family regulator